MADLKDKLLKKLTTNLSGIQGGSSDINLIRRELNTSENKEETKRLRVVVQLEDSSHHWVQSKRLMKSGLRNTRKVLIVKIQKVLVKELTVRVRKRKCKKVLRKLKGHSCIFFILS